MRRFFEGHCSLGAVAFCFEGGLAGHGLLYPLPACLLRGDGNSRAGNSVDPFVPDDGWVDGAFATQQRMQFLDRVPAFRSCHAFAKPSAAIGYPLFPPLLGTDPLIVVGKARLESAGRADFAGGLAAAGTLGEFEVAIATDRAEMLSLRFHIHLLFAQD